MPTPFRRPKSIPCLWTRTTLPPGRKGSSRSPPRSCLRLLGPVGGHGLKPAAAQIERAVYQATFREGRLCEGKARFVIAHSGAAAGVGSARRPELGVGPSPLDRRRRFSKCRRAKPKTRCGGPIRRAGECSSPNRAGRGWRVIGRWPGGPCSARPIFTLVLPPSVVSQVLLSVPDQWALDCSTGRGFSHCQPGPAAGETVWQIDLGSRSSCRVRIDRKPGSAAKPAVFVDQDTAYVVSAEKLQIQSKLQFDVFSAPLTSFSLTVPRRCAWKRFPVPTFRWPSSRTFPKMSKRSMSLCRSRSSAKGGRSWSRRRRVSRTNQMWSLPRIDVPGAVRRDGQVELTIANPLKLLQFGGETAIAQLEAPSYAADGEETFKLRDADHERPISIEVGEPTPTLTASMLQRLDLLRDQCRLAVRCRVCGKRRLARFRSNASCPTCGTSRTCRRSATSPASSTGRAARPRRTRTAIQNRLLSRRHRAGASAVSHRSGADRFRGPGKRSTCRCFRFPGLRTGDLQTVVTHSPAIDLALDPPNEFVPLGQAVISAPFADSPLLPDVARVERRADRRAPEHRCRTRRRGSRSGGASKVSWPASKRPSTWERRK